MWWGETRRGKLGKRYWEMVRGSGDEGCRTKGNLVGDTLQHKANMQGSNTWFIRYAHQTQLAIAI